jgi:small GTP-binding protein
MSSINEVIKSLPQDTQAQLGDVWASLSPAERDALQSVIRGMPSERKLLHLLAGMASTHVKTAFGRKRRVAIVGPANVGKSTLYNQFIQAKEDQAAVSPVPGTTRVNQEADSGLFTVVDTPGADAVGPEGVSERQQAMTAAQAADFLVIMFDAIQGIKQSELALFGKLTALGKPYIVALNKSDLVKRDLGAVVQGAAQNLGLTSEQVIPISAKDGDNVSRVLMAIAVSEPELVAALGSAMPAYRSKLVSRSIITAASLSAVIALTPIPVIDFVPLVAAQSVMVVGIARIYNRPVTVAVARELIATFGLGLIGRTLFQQLSKLGGVPGWLLSAAIASSTTVVMGYAASTWFERGERISPAALKQMTEQLTGTMLASLRSLGRRKPDQQALKARVELTLQALPLASDPTALAHTTGTSTLTIDGVPVNRP